MVLRPGVWSWHHAAHGCWLICIGVLTIFFASTRTPYVAVLRLIFNTWSVWATLQTYVYALWGQIILNEGKLFWMRVRADVYWGATCRIVYCPNMGKSNKRFFEPTEGLSAPLMRTRWDAKSLLLWSGVLGRKVRKRLCSVENAVGSYFYCVDMLCGFESWFGLACTVYVVRRVVQCGKRGRKQFRSFFVRCVSFVHAFMCCVVLDCVRV